MLLFIALAFINYFSFSQEILWEREIFLDTLKKFYEYNYLHGTSIAETKEGDILIIAAFAREPFYPSCMVGKCDLLGNLLWYHLFLKDNPLFESFFFQSEIGDYVFIGTYPLHVYKDIRSIFAPFVAKFSPIGNTPFYEYNIDIEDSNARLLPLFDEPRYIIDNYGNIVYAYSSSNLKYRDTLKIFKFNSDGKFVSYTPIDTLGVADSSYKNLIVFQNEKDEYLIGGYLSFDPNGHSNFFLIKTDKTLKKLF